MLFANAVWADRGTLETAAEVPERGMERQREAPYLVPRRIDDYRPQLDRCEDVVASVRKLADLCAGLDVFHKATLDTFQEPIVRALPNVFVEYLNFDWPVVSGTVHSLPELPQLDDTVAHHGAAH